jgi:hypothetical protein
MIVESQYAGLTDKLITIMANTLLSNYNDTEFVKMARKMTDLDIALALNSHYYIRYIIN